MAIRRRLNDHVTIEVDNAGRWMVMRFAGGGEVHAHPNDDPESVARAHDLGYGGDTWAMSRDHELTYHWLATARGLPFSPTLWAVAQGDKHRVPGVLRQWEEADVLALQRLHRTGEWAGYGRVIEYIPPDLCRVGLAMFLAPFEEEG